MSLRTIAMLLSHSLTVSQSCVRKKMTNLPEKVDSFPKNVDFCMDIVNFSSILPPIVGLNSCLFLLISFFSPPQF